MRTIRFHLNLLCTALINGTCGRAEDCLTTSDRRAFAARVSWKTDAILHNYQHDGPDPGEEQCKIRKIVPILYQNDIIIIILCDIMIELIPGKLYSYHDTL